MKVLFIGGTGVISSACSELAAQRGIDLHLLNRGRSGPALPAGVSRIIADVNNPSEVQTALSHHHFDAIVNFIAFTAADVERDHRLFAGRTGQYLFISSASAYLKPPPSYLITEATPLGNPFWQYARDKIACEAYLQTHHGSDFPVTIVRPSLTYGDWTIPLAVNSRMRPWSVVDRMLKGMPVIVPGDGTSLWTTTHNTDFAKGLIGLLGNPLAFGEAVHITTDEVLTWDQHYQAVGRAVGVEPNLLHVTSEMIGAWDDPRRGSLLGDKSWSTVFDNSKIKRLVPDFRATVPFSEGISRTIAAFRADPSKMEVDAAFNHWCDRLAAKIAECEKQGSAH